MKKLLEALVSSLGVTFVCAGYLLCQWVVFGEVPPTVAIRLTPELPMGSGLGMYNLPFPVSRWWDIVLIIPLSAVFFHLMRWGERAVGEEWFSTISGGLVGTAFFLIIGAATWGGIAFHLAVCMVLWLCLIPYRARVWLGYALLVSLGATVFGGLPYGLIYTVVTLILGFCLVFWRRTAPATSPLL